MKDLISFTIVQFELGMVTFKSLKPVKKIQRRYNNESSGPEVIVGANILIFNSYSTALASILIGQRDNICNY